MEEFFRGSYKVRADEKGRVKVPQDFLSLASVIYDGSKSFYITSTDGKKAQVYSLKAWKELERKIASLESPSPVFAKFLKRAYFFGQMVEMDAAGRLLAPAVLRERLGLKDDVAVIGAMDHIELMSWAAYEKEISEIEITAEEQAELISKLGVMSL